VTTVPPLALLMTPVTALAGPVVSFSLLVAAAIPVSGWAAFVLCRRLTGRFWASLAGGAVYGFSAYEMNHIFAGQLDLAFSLLLPLMAYVVVLWRDGAIGPRVLVALLAAGIALQAYLFLETFALLTAMLVLALAAGYAMAGQPGRPTMARLAGLMGLGYAGGLVLASPYLGYALTHTPPEFQRSPSPMSLKLAGLVVPWPGHTFGLTWLAHAAADLPGPGLDGYLGVPLVLVAIALPVVSRSRRLPWFLAAMTVAAIVLALGPDLHIDNWKPVTSLPWAPLWNLPMARSAYPGRFMVFAQLAVAVMVALWLALPRRGWPAWCARWGLAALGLAAIAANAPPLNLSDQSGLPAFIATGAYQRYLTPGETVVTLSTRGNAGMLWQASTDFYAREAGGYVSEAISKNGGVPTPVANLAVDGPTPANIRKFQSYLTRADISALLVEAGHAGQWPALLGDAGLRGRAIGGVILYQLPAR
jgi:hypothetical protein